jgi:hypothetical protein
MKRESHLGEKKLQEWKVFVKTHRHVFEKIAKGMEKK